MSDIGEAMTSDQVSEQAERDRKALCPECGRPGGGIPCGHYYDAIEIEDDEGFEFDPTATDWRYGRG